MLTERLVRLIANWVELRAIEFQRLFIYFIHTSCSTKRSISQNLRTAFSSLLSSNCFTILELSIWAMVLYWTWSLLSQYRLMQYICNVHHLDVCCTELYESSTSTITRKQSRTHCFLPIHCHFIFTLIHSMSSQLKITLTSKGINQNYLYELHTNHYGFTPLP